MRKRDKVSIILWVCMIPSLLLFGLMGLMWGVGSLFSGKVSLDILLLAPVYLVFMRLMLLSEEKYLLRPVLSVCFSIFVVGAVVWIAISSLFDETHELLRWLLAISLLAKPALIWLERSKHTSVADPAFNEDSQSRDGPSADTTIDEGEERKKKASFIIGCVSLAVLIYVFINKFSSKANGFQAYGEDLLFLVFFAPLILISGIISLRAGLKLKSNNKYSWWIIPAVISVSCLLLFTLLMVCRGMLEA